MGLHFSTVAEVRLKYFHDSELSRRLTDRVCCEFNSELMRDLASHRVFSTKRAMLLICIIKTSARRALRTIDLSFATKFYFQL